MRVRGVAEAALIPSPFARAQGCGFLSLPHAFVESGIIVGPALCIFFAIACNITKDYVLEALGRLEALTKVSASSGA